MTGERGIMADLGGLWIGSMGLGSQALDHVFVPKQASQHIVFDNME
jgi:hypothetical protein